MPFLKAYSKFSETNQAMLWLVRLSHASVAYLKELQKKFPENKDLNKTVFDDVINDCEVLRYIKV